VDFWKPASIGEIAGRRSLTIDVELTAGTGGTPGQEDLLVGTMVDGLLIVLRRFAFTACVRT
jgi:hypothetical protein